MLSAILLLAVASALPARADTSYFRELVNKGNATYYDAYRMMAVLESGQDTPDVKFDELKKGLKELKIVPADWDAKKETEFVNRGELAYMLFKSLEMKGGLTVRIFGVSCRYAFRECVDKKLIVEGFSGQLISGEELISILAEAEKYQQKHLPDKKPVMVVPARPNEKELSADQDDDNEQEEEPEDEEKTEENYPSK
jgi:hypothetical protein